MHPSDVPSPIDAAVDLPTFEPRDAGSRLPRCLVIAEIAQAHDGSLGTAHAYIDAAARAGADAIKFQTHIAAAESTPSEPWRIRFSPQDDTRYQYWKRMEFTESQWKGLYEHARKAGLWFVSSPFSHEAIELLERTGISIWKVASGEISNLPLLERMCATKRPIILSSGMSPWSELDRAVNCLRSHHTPFAVLQCTSAYPCPPERLGLNLIGDIRARYGCSSGLSDHSGTIFAGLAASALGIEVLEVHITMSREMFGPDVTASVTTTELAELVRGIRFIEAARASPIEKDRVADSMGPLRALFTKSIVASRTMAVGSMLTASDVAIKKPGTGLPPERLPHVIGRRLRVAVEEDELLRDEHLEPV